MLMSCQSLPKTPEKEIVDYTSDIAFPTVPAVKANSAAELTDAEYNALIIYVIQAERVFDTIAEREKKIKEGE